MKRRLTVLSILLLGTLFLVAGVFEPREAQAAPCWIDQHSCYTSCGGPQGVSCCCFYHCPSGGQWVCQEGSYCSNSDRSCIWF
jgi:hypothetical protein